MYDDMHHDVRAPKPVFRWLLLVVILMLAGIVGYAFGRLDTTISSSAQTDSDDSTTEEGDPVYDKIFEEVSSQFNLKRDEIQSFTIYGQDKVMFDIGPDSVDTDKQLGAHFAYKQDSRWVEIVAGQEAADCKELLAVPEQYRPHCVDYTTGTVENNYQYEKQYSDTEDGSINYPSAQAVEYIKLSS